MKKHIKFGLGHSKTIALLVLAGAITLPLHGCNDKLEAADAEGAAGAERKLVEEYKASTRAEIIKGGRLYDNWMAEMDLTPPVADNPANVYATVVGASTVLNALPSENQYRCKTCHSYTYQGNDEYGFSGVMDASDNYSVADIEAILTSGITKIDGTVFHRFDKIGGVDMLSAANITALAKFIKYGVVNTSDYIWNVTGAGRGDPIKGEALYEGNGRCDQCHGINGKTINFKVNDTPPGYEVIGTIGQEDPWEMLHTIRFGHAEEPDMPTGYGDSGLSTQDAVDIMTHTQFLPCTASTTVIAC